MSEFESLSGTQAGTIWQLLHDHRSLPELELLALTHFTESQLYTAIGWLARENKIRKENNSYMLGESNLVSFIGKDAGKIWRALEIWGEVDVLSLSRLSRLFEHDVYAAIGWLAREGKVGCAISDVDEKNIFFWLK